MAKDEGSKPPQFQLFQQPSKKEEPLPSEKKLQANPPFQQPPTFQNTPIPPPSANPSLTPWEGNNSTIKRTRTFNGLNPRNKKMLWVSIGVLALGIASYFLIAFLLRERETTPVIPVAKTEKVPAPTTTVAPPSSKPIKGLVKTEKGSNVNMRASPTEDAPVVIPIPSGAEIVILRYGEETEVKGERGKWCRVAYRAKIGWVWGKYVKEKE